MAAQTDNSGRRWICAECETEHHPAEYCPVLDDPRARLARAVEIARAELDEYDATHGTP